MLIKSDKTQARLEAKKDIKNIIPPVENKPIWFQF